MLTDFDDITMEIEEDFANITGAHRELECALKRHESDGESDAGAALFCPYSYDSLLCWPRTPAGTLAVLPCFEELNGVKYDTSREYSSSFRALVELSLFTVSYKLILCFEPVQFFFAVCLTSCLLYSSQESCTSVHVSLTLQIHEVRTKWQRSFIYRCCLLGLFLFQGS